MIRTPPNPQPIAFRHCREYTADLAPVLESLLEPLGGMAAFVKSGQTVILKPNLLSDRHPDQAITTHPALVQAVIRLVRRQGGIPRIADSPAAAVKLERVWEKTGMKALAETEQVDLINLEQAGSVRFDDAEGSFTIAKPILEADVLINIPKVKTHVFMTLTGAVKNLYGTIPGYQKTHLHKQHPDPFSFARLLARIHDRIPPAVTILDGIVGMEGNGPSGGTPRAWGFLAAGRDAFQLDAFLCALLKIPLGSVPYLFKDRLPSPSCSSVDAFDIRGDTPRLDPRPCQIPPSFLLRFIPRFLVKLVAPYFWLRPAIAASTCIRCLQCVAACPMQALTTADRQVPTLTPSRCIGCCCCHEVCPVKAISMERSPLLRMIRRKRNP
ncbi:MAG: hypothetical protein A2498_08740 [Lentisphaerae bacterium RIFOXYC12_FULL_60_16]|nr:MAG: hypothetical protein A2498_08740 [Lentisphaerae bacterium RIFOXYC12_FULL_60_16]OGV68494.1 MAG: hypothetical protein A2269_01465 [Lentisphaerae bacterium RIFOXYA12_FULL_60_10]OGV81011.1 MAG: hypothetical protein A2340_07100 [Lentisphaerae bacterium RIFOXYB12_FULL_60_10]